MTEGGPAVFSSRLLRRARLSGDTFELDLERPRDFRFEPGQGIRFLHDGTEREYSLTCASDAEVLSICVRRVDGGVFSPLLAEAEVGSRLTFSGPHGFFVFRPSPRPCIFVATGTGIAPFVSMARSGVTGFFMLQGAATSRDLHYHPVVAPTARAYVACTSREQPPGPPRADLRAGRVTDYIRDALPKGRFDFYLCGRREMIRDVVRLVDERFDGSKVYSEIFF